MFEIVVYIAMGIAAYCILATLLFMLHLREEYSRAVIADIIFYGMLCFYILWAMLNDNQISYEVVLLAALLGGALPTMSMARILTKGRR